jgi:hypothetical protein
VTVAALDDVHANLPAFEAVLADGAADAGVLVFGGDLDWPFSLSLGGALDVHATPRRDDEIALPSLRDGDDVELGSTDYDTAATADAMDAARRRRLDVADELRRPYTLERSMELL